MCAARPQAVAHIYIAGRFLCWQHLLDLWYSATTTACPLVVCHVPDVTKQSFLVVCPKPPCRAFALHAITLCAAMPQACVHLAGRFCTGNSCRAKHVYAPQGNRQAVAQQDVCVRCACGALSVAVTVHSFFAATLLGPIPWQVFVQT